MIDLDAAYDVLVRICGARDGADAFGYTDRWYFIESIQRQLDSHAGVEYRFQGALGFGGKFRYNDSRWYVDCYPEDETDERRGRIAVANHLLAELADQRS